MEKCPTFLHAAACKTLHILNLQGCGWVSVDIEEGGGKAVTSSTDVK